MLDNPDACAQAAERMRQRLARKLKERRVKRLCDQQACLAAEEDKGLAHGRLILHRLRFKIACLEPNSVP